MLYQKKDKLLENIIKEAKINDAKSSVEKPKRGRKVATSRPDKKENAEIFADSNKETAEKKNEDKDNKKEGIFKEIELGILNVEQFLKDINDNKFVNSNLKMEGHTFKVTVENAEKSQYLMIPINYDNDWKAKNNGKEIEIRKKLFFINT